MAGRGYQELIAWQKSMDLVEAVYRVSSDLPPEERFGLMAQLRRAAVSIPSNVAEGHGRSSPRDFGRFLEIALGSLAEVETQLMLTTRLRFLPEARIEPVLSQAAEAGRVINGLWKSL
jgi:four helix bundle protein